MIRLSGVKNSSIYLFTNIDPITAVYIAIDDNEELATAVATTTNTFYVNETPEQVISILNNVTLPLTN